jgi:hypothetical protein
MTLIGTTFARRGALAIGLAFVVIAMAWPAPTDARPILQRGVSGGGTVELEEGGAIVADLSLFASALNVPDADADFVVGSVLWAESGGLVLESLEVTACVVMPEREDGREVRGTMSVNGAGSYQFVLRVIDAGPPGSGFDSVDLVVGGAVDAEEAAEATPTTLRRRGFSYSAAGPVIGGDFENLSIDLDIPDPTE